MPRSKVTALERQLACVRRRFGLQIFLRMLVWFLSGGLLLSAGWLLVAPWLIDRPPSGLGWWVASGLGAAAVLAVLVAWRRRPAPSETALALDERFGLKERATTALLLTPRESASPTGRALHADAEKRLAPLDVPSLFLIRLGRKACLASTAAIVFSAAALFFKPSFRDGPAPDQRDDQPLSATEVASIQKKLRLLGEQEKASRDSTPFEREAIARLRAKLAQIAEQPPESAEQARERIKELNDLEGPFKDRDRELAERRTAIREELRQLNKLARDAETREGPARDLHEALAQGDLAKTRQALADLETKLKELDVEAGERLADQLETIQKDLKRLARKTEQREELDRQKQAGQLEDKDFERAQQRLEKEAEKLKDLEDLAARLGEAQKRLKNEDNEAARKQLRAAAATLEGLDREATEVREGLTRLQEARDILRQGISGGNDGERVAESSKPRNVEAQLSADPSGKQNLQEFLEGKNPRLRTTAEMAGAIEQARQEAAAALEQQRIPRAYRDSVREYFRNLGEMMREGKQ